MQINQVKMISDKYTMVSYRAIRVQCKRQNFRNKSVQTNFQEKVRMPL